MSDLIDRQAAIEAVQEELNKQERSRLVNIWTTAEVRFTIVELILKQLPTAEPYNLDEWCEDCKEYDNEKHCCPRFNRVIRTAMEESMKETKGEEKDG